MWRIVVVPIGGAVTIASRFVTCESVSVVDPHRLVDLAPHEREPELLARRLGQQPIDVVAVAGVRRHPARGRVRMGEQPALLEHGELVADRRRPGGHVRVGGERLRAHRLPGLREAVHHFAEEEGLTGRKHNFRF